MDALANTTVFVTGATGFIGRHLMPKLAAHAKEVRCLVRSENKAKTFAHYPNVRLVRGDLSDIPSFAAALHGVDAVLNLAGVLFTKNTAEFDTINAGAALSLLRHANTVASVSAFIHISSLAAVGPSPDGRPLTEADAFEPVSEYGRSKRRSEALLLAEPTRCSKIIVRPPIVYGPEDQNTLPLIKAASLGILPHLGTTTCTYSGIHVDDLVSALLCVLATPRTGNRTYFVCGPEPVVLERFLRAFAQAFGKRGCLVRIPEWLAKAALPVVEAASGLLGTQAIPLRDKLPEMLVKTWLANDALLRRETGYMPTVTVEEGVRRTVAWFKASGGGKLSTTP